MTKTFESDLILTEDTTFNESIIVKGNIFGKDGLKFNLKVAGDINARNIDAGNINAGDIKYYTVCFAYNNIKCNSIKGKRENCKHFVLDGNIEINKEGKT